MNRERGRGKRERDNQTKPFHNEPWVLAVASNKEIPIAFERES